MRSSFLSLLLLFALCAGAQNNGSRALSELKQANFDKVLRSKKTLENLGGDALPGLVALTLDTTFVPLTNTADLIYPGARKFYGHGYIVPYNLDWIAIRAAWVLEEISFENFGYLDTTISEAKLMELHVADYDTYLKTGAHAVNFAGNSTPAEQVARLRLLGALVNDWWARQGANWNRFAALRAALASTDLQRQGQAFQYLRFGKSACPGLTMESYRAELQPLVEKIAATGGGEAQQAQLLLEDKEGNWFNQKKKD